MPLSSEQRVEAEADLQELYAARVDEHGHAFARRRFYRDVVSLLFGSPPSDRNGHRAHPRRPLLRSVSWRRTSATALGSCSRALALPPLRCFRWRSASASTPRFSRSSDPCLLAPLPVPEPHELATAHWWRGDEVRGMMQINSGGADRSAVSGRNLSTNYDYVTYTALRGTPSPIVPISLR